MANRRIWIVAKKERIEDSNIADAKLNGCPEIANGIPPALQNIISETQLPIAYQEPELPQIPPRNLAAEIDGLKARIEKLENSRLK